MAEITVRGAGILGLSVAWELLERGADVTVIDPYGIGAGASGGVVGALAPHTPENWNPKKQLQFDSLIAAEGFWRRVEGAGGVASGYGRLGRLQVIGDARALELAEQRGRNAVELWQGEAVWEVIGAEAAASLSGGAVPESPSGQYIFDSLSGRIHPARACAALAAAIRQRGGKILAEGPDRGAVVWATGVAGLQALSEGAARPLGGGVKGQAAVLALDMGDAPQLFIDTMHIIPHADGTVAIGSTSEREFEAGEETDGLLDALLARAVAAVPALKGVPVVARWAGVRPRARSRAPMLGPWPDRPGHYVANGGFKIGFGMAPAMARLLADAILSGENDIPAEFSVSASI
ncbi:FAD-binding oxidoreductase [Alphaproteobacteria bacterium KMM 3653]|uniref:FAD-binding oxidoreductase n=1 Tax=Harenicola maris TaxID=2841044 RepID=A0AAP2CTN9_9RHOB|nr:FAD-binding oxidoreductase [Harenicola maris]